MARPFEMIKDINDQKELWKIVVKVHHKWTVISNNKEHFEMIFIDKEAGIEDPLEYPLALDSFLGLRMKFKVKWQLRWGNAYVISVFHDEPVIKQLLGNWEKEKIKQSVDKANTENDYEVVTIFSVSSHVSTKFLNATIYHI
ncbi:hypothetical protein KIW84_010498 [Lathyrus oleraceus]|uniref:DUF223 domain-containing protein n=1 Tax=Pisum sativum TaxID=3888 RepID=A0A9D4YL30_PEA|nr:hypothetical protein KIW84_010498 [Pisum sativum]